MSYFTKYIRSGDRMIASIPRPETNMIRSLSCSSLILHSQRRQNRGKYCFQGFDCNGSESGQGNDNGQECFHEIILLCSFALLALVSTE